MRVRRTRSDNDMVISYLRNYLPLATGEKIKKEDLSTHTMIHVLKKQLGIPLSNAIQHIEAIAADFDVAAALAINISAPVLYVDTLYFIRKEKPVAFSQTFHRSDMFRYTMELDMDEPQPV
jgi:GntR family transcriptional regulator